MSKKIGDTPNDVQLFKVKLQEYKALIDADIEAYCQQVSGSTGEQYGEYSKEVIDAYLSILKRGAKRIRGVLTMVGYEMSGGQNQQMILKAARAIEMIQAYILIIDDFQDNSSTRRGGASAHVLLANYHKSLKLKGNNEHFGKSQAVMGALIGNHAAQIVLANLEVDSRLALNALSIVNRGMIVTGHGQINDIMNEVSNEVTEADIDSVMSWKTAHYTFLNPLHTGMILAGADCHATDAITEYCMKAGRAFQISDDVLGVFGDQTETGKDPTDDIREGKRTLLITKALQNSTGEDKKFLKRILGNKTITQAEFAKCKKILVDSGAVDHCRNKSLELAQEAVAALGSHQNLWPETNVAFLRGLAMYLPNRNS